MLRLYMKIEKTDNSGKVVKAGAGYVIGNYLLKGITFLSAPIFTRLLSTAEFGDFNTYLSYEAIFFIIVGLALHSSVNSAKYKFADKLEEYVSSIIVLILSSSAIWCILANIFFTAYSEYLDLDRLQVNILVFHCLSSALFQVYTTYISLSYSYINYLKVTAINAIANIVISLVFITTIFSESRTLGRILGTVIPIGFIGIYIVIWFFKKARPRIKIPFWKFGLRYSLPIVPHGISQVILSSFDRIMIKKMIGSAEAGIYSFSYTILSLFKVATSSLENVWKPWVFEKMNKQDYVSIKKRGNEYALGLAVFVVLIVLTSPEIIKILGDVDYWQSTPCVVPVMVGGFFAFLYTLPSAIEYYYEKTQFIAAGTIGAASLNILLNYFCIKEWGYIAAAYTTLITYLLYFVFHFFLARKIHGHQIFSSKTMTLISGGTIIFAGIALMLEKYWFVRWMLVILILSASCFYIEKKYKGLSWLLSKLKKTD